MPFRIVYNTFCPTDTQSPSTAKMNLPC